MIVALFDEPNPPPTWCKLCFPQGKLYYTVVISRSISHIVCYRVNFTALPPPSSAVSVCHHRLAFPQIHPTAP